MEGKIKFEISNSLTLLNVIGYDDSPKIELCEIKIYISSDMSDDEFSKFTNEAFDMQQLKKLQSKVFVDGNIYFYLFSLSGFTDAVQEYATLNKNVSLVTADDIVALAK